MRNSNYSLKGLVRRLFFSLLLAIAGSWLLIVSSRGAALFSQLTEFDWNRVVMKLGSVDVSMSMMADYIGVSLVFLGLFMAFFYRGRLAPRLKRLYELGEDRW